MSKYKKNYWNFRVVTYLNGNDAERFGGEERLFSIVEVYYTNGKPDSYVDSKRILDGLASVKELKWTNKKIKRAFKKPVLDLDRWPHKYKK